MALSYLADVHISPLTVSELSKEGYKVSRLTDFLPTTSSDTKIVDFARTEGRFSKQFDEAGNPSEALLMGQEDRLRNWHTLQELAGFH